MAPDAGTNVVDVYVNYLRKKLVLGESAMGDPVIGTVRGAGYMIGGVVQTTGRKPVRSEALFGRSPLMSEDRLAEA